MRCRMLSFSACATGTMDRLAQSLKTEEDWEIETVVKTGSLPERADPRPIQQIMEESFRSSDLIVFFGAAGIAVRSIAPHIRHKSSDPAVLAVDEKGIWCIPLLSGHAGRANELADKVSEILGSTPVITTATDLEGKFAVDLFAVRNGLEVADWTRAKELTAEVLQGKRLRIFSELPKDRFKDLPDEKDVQWTEDPEDGEPDVVISWRSGIGPEKALLLIPPILAVGIGCRKGTSAEQILKGLERFLGECGIDKRSLFCIASIDLKEKEPGLLKTAQTLSVPFYTFPAETLNELEEEMEASGFVRQVTGTDNVCQRSALTAAGPDAELAAAKKIIDGVTYAAAIRRKWN